MTRSARRWRVWLAQGSVVAVAAAVLVYLGSRLFIGYDSFWHVFIARQDRWSHFWSEVFSNAHPPLFFLLLRPAADVFGSNRLAYRLVSIVATVAALPLLGAVVRRVTGNRALAIVAMAAYGLSYSVLTMGVEVRSYALSAAFTLAAYVCYLDWLKTPGHRLRASTWLGFALATTAAVLSHYNSFFFIAAAMGTPVVLAIVSSGWRRRLLAKVVARPGATAVMFGVPIGVAAIFYYLQAVQWGGGQLNHVAEYMYTPGRETPIGFLLTNIGRLAGMFVPGGEEFKPAFINDSQWIALAVLGVVCLIGLARLASARTPRLAVATVVFFLILVAINAVAGLAARYPFGGTLRHEFHLMAFAAIALFALVESAQRALPGMVRKVVPIAAACGVVTSIMLWTSSFTVVTEQIFQAQMDKFRQVVVSPQAVMVDAFTFINFYMHHHDWKWELEGEWPDRPIRQVWRLTRGQSIMKLCRETQWAFDVSIPATYASAVQCLKKTSASRVALLRTQWNLQTPSWDTSKTVELVTAMADEADLRPRVLETSGGDVYAELEVPKELYACDAPPPPPKDLVVTSNSDRVVGLSWTPVGNPRVFYIVEAGRGPRLSDVLRVNIGRTTTYTAKAVPPAKYYARVVSENACGTSAPTNEITVVVE